MTIIPELKQTDFKNNIRNVQDFYKAFRNKYQSLLKENINPAFQDSLPFNNGCLNMTAIVSSYKNLYLSIRPSESNAISIFCSDYSAQLAKMIGPENISKTGPILIAGKWYSNKDSINLAYDSIPATFPYCRNLIFDGIGLWGPKPFTLCPNQSIWVREGTPIISLFKKDTINVLQNEIVYYFGDNYLEDCTTIGENIAKLCFDDNLRSLLIRSELFRKAMAHPKLITFAQNIAKKKYYSDSLKIYDADYPPWQLELDVRNLQQMALNEGIIDSDYVNILLVHEIGRQKTSILLWPYGGYWSYAIQWTIPLAVLLVILFFIIRHSQFTKNPRILIYSLNLLYGCAIWWSVYAFERRPINLNVAYWVIPILALLLNLILIGKIQIKMKLSKSSDLK